MLEGLRCHSVLIHRIGDDSMAKKSKKTWSYSGGRLFAFRMKPGEVEKFNHLVDAKYNGNKSSCIRNLILEAYDKLKTETRR